MCDQTRQKGNLLPCPGPYVTEVMFYDIHPDSDTHQLEVLSPLSGASIWNSAIGRRKNTRRMRVDGGKKSPQNHVVFVHMVKPGAWDGARTTLGNPGQSVSIFSFLLSKVRAAAKTERKSRKKQGEREKLFRPRCPINLRRTRKCQQD